VFIPNGVVGISPSSTSPDVTDLDDNGYIFRTAPSDLLQGPAMAELARGDLVGAESSGTLYLNDAYGRPVARRTVRGLLRGERRNDRGARLLRAGAGDVYQPVVERAEPVVVA